MRNSAVRSAHASNQEIAIFSGDFLPADGALPWRRQEAPGDSPPEGLIVLRTLTPSSAPQTPPLNLRFRGGKKSAATFATYYAKKGFTCYAFFVAANFAFRTLRLRKVQTCAVAAPLHKNLFSENIFVRNMVILICAGALWGKSELTRAKLKAIKNRVKRGESMRYADSRGAASAHART